MSQYWSDWRHFHEHFTFCLLPIIKQWQSLERLQCILLIKGSDQMIVTILSADPFYSLWLSSPFPDHSKCAHWALKWKSLMGPYPTLKNSLAFLLCAQFTGVLKGIKYDNSAISSRLNLFIIALNQSYIFLVGLLIFSLWSTHGQWCINSYQGGNEREREPWSPLRW